MVVGMVVNHRLEEEAFPVAVTELLQMHKAMTPMVLVAVASQQ